jgi:hypothetical protein
MCSFAPLAGRYDRHATTSLWTPVAPTAAIELCPDVAIPMDHGHGAAEGCSFRSFWTPDTDTRLQRLEAQGLSAAKIAAKLGVSRSSVIARSQRLRGLSRTFPSYLREQEKARASIAARKRKMDAVLSKFHQEIARGVARNEAIAHARKAGATLQAIGEVLGITRQRVRQILNRQRLRELRMEGLL